MSFLSEQVKIAEVIAAGWDNSVGSYVWRNQPFEEPANSVWATLNIVNNSSKLNAIGANPAYSRYFSVFTAEILVPTGQGTHPGRKMGQLLAGILRAKSFLTSDGDQICFYAVSMRQPAINTVRAMKLKNTWEVMAFIAPFYRDEIT